MRLGLLILGFFWFTSSLAQDSVGFFMIMHVKKKVCQKFLPSLDGKKEFCLAPEAIIPVTEFATVSEVKIDPMLNYINLTFTPAGFDKYKAISSNLKGMEMALIVSNKVVGIFSSEGKIPKRTIQIGENMTLADLDWIYQRLKYVTH